jgi:hypothetical protein
LNPVYFLGILRRQRRRQRVSFIMRTGLRRDCRSLGSSVRASMEALNGTGACRGSRLAGGGTSRDKGDARPGATSLPGARACQGHLTQLG